MPDNVTVQITAVAVHQAAESACCAAPLGRAAEGTEEFTCQACGQPAERVLGEPERIPAGGTVTVLHGGGA
jgi:hypothetical protein